MTSPRACTITGRPRGCARADGHETGAPQTGAGPTTDDGAGTGCVGRGDDWNVGDDFETSGGGAEDTNAGMGDDIPIGATVFVVRTGGIDAGTLVEIDALVVTSPVASDRGEYLVFVQAPEGARTRRSPCAARRP